MRGRLGRYRPLTVRVRERHYPTLPPLKLPERIGGSSESEGDGCNAAGISEGCDRTRTAVRPAMSRIVKNAGTREAGL